MVMGTKEWDCSQPDSKERRRTAKKRFVEE